MTVAIGMHVYSSGWKRSEKVHVYDGGSWKECHKVWARSSGVWKEIFVDEDREISVSNQSAVTFWTDAAEKTLTSRYIIQTSGQAQLYTTDGGNPATFNVVEQWKRFDYARTYQARWEKVSGSIGTFTGPGGESEATWFTIDGEKTWQLQHTGLQFSTTHKFDIRIRQLGGSELDSARITLTLNKDDLS